MSKPFRARSCFLAIAILSVSCGGPTKQSVIPSSGGGSAKQSVMPSSDSTLDQKTIEQLRTAGSDLSKAHSIEFYLYVPSEKDAQDAAATLQTNEFNTVIRSGARGKNWLCLAQKRMTPTIENLTNARQLFAGLATRYRGKYDGWKASVEP